MGLSLELYSDNPNDSTSTPGPAVIAQRVIDGARPGAIIIIHSEDQGTQALPAILSGLKAKDYDVIP
jgi:TusA-related sulfurtransferase